jgi:Fe-S-cluster-containing dehydrogenase component
MKPKWNLVIDVALCENCSNCVLAAKDELAGNDFPGYSAPHAAHGPGVIRLERHVRGAAPMVDVAHVPRLCNHCDDAPCVKAGQGAVKKRDDGIVIVDPVAARGRRDLVASCPYGAMVWNEEQQLAQTWFFDAHLLDAGAQAPRCVGVCPTQAITAFKCDDATMTARAATEGLRPLQPGLGTKPRVYYRNLYRADHCFIGGSVVARVGGRIECIADARVVLHAAGREIANTRSDAFGDFRFDALAPGSGSYRCVIEHPEHGGFACELSLDADSLVLGELELRR